ncbi:MAG: tRNA (guanosine(46)-N7)-methyltransferase TrmB [Bacilli bacterium]
MRLRNVTGAKEVIEKSKYVILDPVKNCCKWQSIFGNNNPIHIEIGMGKGDFIREHAKRDTNINFIGIEKFDNVIVRAVQKLEDTNYENLKLIRMDALEINEVFKNEVDCIYLNFSDPWPKNRHEKKRLTSNNFLDKYDSVFKKTKKIIMKTDNRKLFEFSVTSFVEKGYKIDNLSLDLYGDDIKDNIPTEYETKFNLKGQVIYMIEVSKM